MARSKRPAQRQRSTGKTHERPSAQQIQDALHQLLLEALEHEQRTDAERAAMNEGRHKLNRDRAFVATIEALAGRHDARTKLRNRIESAVVLEQIVEVLLKSESQSQDVVARSVEAQARGIVTPRRNFPDTWAERLVHAFRDSAKQDETTARTVSSRALDELAKTWCPDVDFPGVERANRVLRGLEPKKNDVVQSTDDIETIMNEHWMPNARTALLLTLRALNASSSLIELLLKQYDEWARANMPNPQP